MARLGVMTFLHNDNYGSTLQAWALQRVLVAMGHDVEHIDYRPSRAEKARNLLRSGNSPRLVLEGLRKKAVKANRPGARRKAEAFTAFYASSMRLSPPCRDHAALRRQARAYDALICGSDQIWSPVWLNPAYFLDFAAPVQPRLAYAPSLGVSQVASGRKAHRLAALLRGFDAVSVREAEGAEALRQITGSRPAVMPDPVLLVGREEWLALAERPSTDKPYLLCYFIGEDAAYWRRARQLAEALGLTIRVLPVTEAAYQSGCSLADGASPAAWVGLMAGAAHIITDSFHGTAFAAMLHRPCTVLRRYREDDPESKNSRIVQLTRTLGLDNMAEGMDWARMDERLAAVRQEGLAWLRDAVHQASAGLQGPSAGASEGGAAPR